MPPVFWLVWVEAGRECSQMLNKDFISGDLSPMASQNCSPSGQETGVLEPEPQSQYSSPITVSLKSNFTFYRYLIQFLTAADAGIANINPLTQSGADALLSRDDILIIININIDQSEARISSIDQ